MKVWITKCKSERGIALVITLMMLAVVTVMAIVFLALSRRERASVILSEDLGIANYMAEAALERAKAQAIARMIANGSVLDYDLFVSTNFVNPAGFEPQGGNRTPNLTNVSYFYANGQPVSESDRLQVIANLQYDPRVPVNVETNENGEGEFRYFLDFNRNRVVEANGILTNLGFSGEVLRDPRGNIITNFFVGDPEWIGVLERPDQPHGENNRAVGRMAYLVLPAGKTLDLNYIHNQADPASPDNLQARGGSANGFTRNQGFGSWEINLAAFLRELNTNVYGWPNYESLTGRKDGFPFNDARALLSFRYANRRSTLQSANFTLGNNNFVSDGIDNYGDGPNLLGFGSLDETQPGNADNPNAPWPGSLNTNVYTDVQELFTRDDYSTDFRAFTARLTNSMAPIRLSSYDRYTMYRLLRQFGADSTPNTEGKVHLNYANEIGELTNLTHGWTTNLESKSNFFMRAAEQMLRASIDGRVTVTNRDGSINVFYQIADTLVRTNFSLANIQIYTNPPPVGVFSTANEYTPTIHRILQVAANICDNMENEGNAGYPFYSSVFRPVYTKTPSSLTISGFVVETNAAFANSLPWRDIQEIFAPSSTVQNGTNIHLNLYGQPVVMGVKKGHPNFNELALQSIVEVNRKIQLQKTSRGALTPSRTNQMFLVSLQNRWGLEAWNSYRADYPRDAIVRAEIVSKVALYDTNISSFVPVFYITNNALTNFSVANWTGTLGQTNSFIAAINTNFSLLLTQPYRNGMFQTNEDFGQFTPIEQAPKFYLVTTNKVRYWVTDNSNRLIDYVTFDNLRTSMDISTNLYSQETSQFAATNAFNENILWDPTPLGPPGSITVGISNQIAVSRGQIDVPNPVWRSSSFSTADKTNGIRGFQAFINDPALVKGPNDNTPWSPEMQTPFVPSRRMHQLYTWQANDPLVHFVAGDLTRPPASGKPVNVPMGTFTPTWNIGAVNDVYHPWGGGTQTDRNNDPFAWNVGLQDPAIRSSDHWNFPVGTNKAVFRFPGVGWLGRIHRGTPWQTLYMKSTHYVDGNDGQGTAFVTPERWIQWSGSRGTHPKVDWKLFGVFTVAPNEAATRGLLSVNQAEKAAWSAVLSGITVFTNTLPTGEALSPPANIADAYQSVVIEPATPQIQQIVQSINFWRTNQTRIERVTANNLQSWEFVHEPNSRYFKDLGSVLNAPALSTESPYLNRDGSQIQNVWVDEAVERIPQQIMSLLQRDEPRFVVYAYGQSLRPAPRSLATDSDFYNLCTNYQITGEVISKTTFRVEGELNNPANPLRSVVENYSILPPPE